MISYEVHAYSTKRDATYNGRAAKARNHYVTITRENDDWARKDAEREAQRLIDSFDIVSVKRLA